MENDINTELLESVAACLEDIARANGDAYRVADAIQNAFILERNKMLPNTDDVATLLAFLYFFREEAGANAMYGGRRVDEAIAAACRMGYIDETRLKEVFDA